MFVDRLIKIENEIKNIEESLNRTIGEVEIMIVTKKQDIKTISNLVDRGYTYFGENRVDELIEKKRLFSSGRFAYIAPIQSKKFEKIMINSAEIHSISRTKEIQLMSEYHWNGDYFIQVNVDRESQKSGVMFEQAIDLVTFAYEKFRLPKGIMCIRALGNKTTPAESFKLMKELNIKIKSKYCKYDGQLSMGMSNDYREAIIYGSTVVRIGNKIFGG